MKIGDIIEAIREDRVAYNQENRWAVLITVYRPDIPLAGLTIAKGDHR